MKAWGTMDSQSHLCLLQIPRTFKQMRSAQVNTLLLVPGAWVRNPQAPDWGLGQVQSVVGQRVTVNFENRGKVLINAANVTLEVVDGERP